MNAQVKSVRRPAGAPKRKGEHLSNAVTLAIVAHARNLNPSEVVAELYGDSRDTVLLVQRAVSNPADTATPSWAGALVREQAADFLLNLGPLSLISQLLRLKRMLTFDAAGRVKVPVDDPSAPLAGDFVAELAPIPVKQGKIASVTLTPKKAAIITAFSREMALSTSPPFGDTVSRWMRRDTTKLLDTRLLDAEAGTAVRPAGILNGITVGTGAAGTDPAANLSADIATLMGPQLSNGAIMPVLLVHPIQKLSIALTTTPSGLQFAEELRADGTIVSFPVLSSPQVPAGTVIALDLDALAIAGEAVPELLVSEQATLHMEDTAPKPINDGTAASPVRSLFQTATIGVRLLWFIDWAMTRGGLVTALKSVQW